MTDPVEPVEPPDSVEPVEPVGDTYAVDEGDEVDGEPAPDEPRRYPSTIGGACYLAILLAALAALGIIVGGGDWRVGVRVLAASLASGGAVRLLLSQRDAGMLAVRHRLVDVTMLVGVAALLWWLAGSIPDQPM